MQFNLNANLKSFHTFGLEQTCDVLVKATSIDDLKSIYQSHEWQDMPKLVIGKGSNMLFTEHYQGVVVINQILGKSVRESCEHYHLHIQGGEDWPSLVRWTIDKNIGGLENLAMIPGCAGSAPIQNIGAYGVELKDVCEYVDFLLLDTLDIIRLTAEQCKFGYRDSIFKHDFYGKGVVVAIGLKLTKCWKAYNHYGPLQAISEDLLSPKSIFDEVCAIRASKLPDPNVVGNAGSFFKNPEIELDHFDQIKALYPSIIGHPVGGKIKVAAGWLIDQCGFKGISVGGAQVHPNQALVLTNISDAKPSDVIKLAQLIRNAVFERYQITLEHEVRFMGKNTETNLSQIVGSDL